METIKHVLSTTELDALLQDSSPLIVDFWAPWCGPCRMLGPVFEELSEEYEGKLLFAKVNVDENRELAKRYRIMSIPQLLLFKDGQLLDSMLGAQSKDTIEKLIRKAL